MDTKIKWMITFIGFCVIIISSSCGKLRLDCAKAVYSFKGSAVAYPDKDSIHVGDTIWIKSNISTSLMDQTSSQIIDYSNASNLSLAIKLLRFTGGSINNPGAYYAANDFAYYPFIGTKIDDPFTEGQRTFSFIEQNNFYNLNIAIIAKTKGTYLIGISNAVNIYRKTDKCTKAHYEITFTDTNQHLYFSEKNRPGYVMNNYEQTHNYYLKVY